jgi:hypothetical protein
LTLRLPRLEMGRAIVDGQGRPTLEYQQLWQKSAKLSEANADANDATNATQDAALDILDTAYDRATQAWERIGPGEYSFTASATLPDDCRTALVDATAGAVTLTLLPLADSADNIFCVKVDASANAMTIDGDGAETISGAANKSTTTQWATIKVRPCPAAGYWVQI